MDMHARLRYDLLLLLSAHRTGALLETVLLLRGLLDHGPLGPLVAECGDSLRPGLSAGAFVGLDSRFRAGRFLGHRSGVPSVDVRRIRNGYRAGGLEIPDRCGDDGRTGGNRLDSAIRHRSDRDVG